MPKKKNSSPRKKLTQMPQAGTALDLRTAIIGALEDERYDWRTIKGLAKELRVSEVDVVAALNSLLDRIVRSQDADGRSLFTTRAHYEKTHGFSDKLLSALADRIVA